MKTSRIKGGFLASMAVFALVCPVLPSTSHAAEDALTTPARTAALQHPTAQPTQEGAEKETASSETTGNTGNANTVKDANEANKTGEIRGNNEDEPTVVDNANDNENIGTADNGNNNGGDDTDTNININVTDADAAYRPITPIGVDAKGRALKAPKFDASDANKVRELASFWPKKQPSFSVRSVIDEDERKRITKTAEAPHSAIVYITQGGEAQCTGWMVSEDTLVTAGHCIYDRSHRSFFKELQFHPGANGRRRPFGTVSATQLWTDESFAEHFRIENDWGVVKLDHPIGRKTGWFGLRTQTGDFDGTVISVEGYPGDKPAGQMWGMDGTIEATSPNQLCYSVDTVGGQSGSPVFTSDSRQAIAIHSYGTGRQMEGMCIGDLNGGTRITPDLYEFIMAVR
ncbi:MAG: trypsin-like serine protease [Actinomycetaceae bacterium]|nr:trypsin-like serine protease [Actinomycetaceae bacterium]